MFNWAYFVNKIANSTPARYRNEVAKYLYLVAVVIQMDFEMENPILNAQKRANEIASHFGVKPMSIVLNPEIVYNKSSKSFFPNYTHIDLLWQICATNLA